MPFDPDTEIQYRKGGKIMKKTPRKFQAGGATASAPTSAPKPAPKRVTTPSDQPDPETAAKMRQQAAEAKMDERQRKAAEDFYGDKQRLGNKMKKGGKVKKYADGGETQAEDKDIFYTGRFKGEDGDDTYRRAYNYVNKLRTPSGAEETEVKARTGLQEPSVRKAAPKAAPKAVTPTPKAAAPAPKAETKATPKAEPKATPKAEEKGPEKDFERAGKVWNAVKSFGSSLDSAMKNSRLVQPRFKKGGGIESKGKTAGKIVKMAKGGSVRGYGISKVTNKTKIV